MTEFEKRVLSLLENISSTLTKMAQDVEGSAEQIPSDIKTKDFEIRRNQQKITELNMLKELKSLQKDGFKLSDVEKVFKTNK